MSEFLDNERGGGLNIFASDLKMVPSRFWLLLRRKYSIYHSVVRDIIAL